MNNGAVTTWQGEIIYATSDYSRSHWIIWSVVLGIVITVAVITYVKKWSVIPAVVSMFMIIAVGVGCSLGVDNHRKNDAVRDSSQYNSTEIIRALTEAGIQTSDSPVGDGDHQISPDFLSGDIGQKTSFVLNDEPSKNCDAIILEQNKDTHLVNLSLRCAVPLIGL